MAIRMKHINDCDLARFVELLGDIFEHSPWIAERAYLLQPFATRAQLHQVMVKTLHQASQDEKLKLLRAGVLPLGIFAAMMVPFINGWTSLVESSAIGAMTALLAALVTPPDVVTQLILFTVVYGLYEISIHLVSRVEKQREEKLREEGYYDDEMDEDLADEEATK